MKKKEQLTCSVAVTPSAYSDLQKMSQLTGISLGQLASSAIGRALNPQKNPELARALSDAREQLARAAS